MDVSIVLVSYNTCELTKNCIKSIFDKTQGLDFDVWVVDNASSDNSVAMVREEFPQVKLIASEENLGFGRANNLAIKQIDSKYVFLLNTDTVLINNAVKILYDFLENPANADVGCCGGQLYNADRTLQGSVGEFDTLEYLVKKTFGLNWTNRIVRLKGIFKREFLKEKIYEQSNDIKPYEPDYIIGADMMLRKSVLDKVGMFNERFFMFAEEAELCFRIKKNGFKVMFVPDSQIIHYGGASAKSTNHSLAVEKMLLVSNIVFYELCYGIKAAKIAKALYIIYYLRYLVLRFFSPKAFKRLKMALEL